MDVAAWLEGLGLGRYAQAFRDNDVNADVLPRLTAEDLTSLGVASIGDRRKLLDAIAALHAQDGLAPFAAGELPPRTATRFGEAERRRVTVMFVDLVGSTALSTRLDPEEMGEVLRAYRDAAAGELACLGGHVARFLGDGVLAYFGWPEAYEDDAERAVRAGLAAAAAVGRLTTPTSGRLVARVGIATGLVVVGELVGEGTAREEVIVGETPNLAARLQAAAGPGEVVIDAGTRRLLGTLFELEGLGALELKGFAAPVDAYVVRGEARVQSRFDALKGDRLTPLVGREHELDFLLRAWEAALGGRGRAVLLAGEAGIGKSRLARAAVERAAADGGTVLDCFCSPHHSAAALFPIRRQLERAAGLESGDPAPIKLTKLEQLLAQTGVAPGQALPLLASLLGISLHGSPFHLPSLTPAALKMRTLGTLLDQLTGIARRRPLLILLEDLQWADPTTLELLTAAVPALGNLPGLLLVTARPEFRPPWPDDRRVDTVVLSRLDQRRSASLLRHVAGAKHLPEELEADILAKTDGVPLFLEELTKAVLEAGWLWEAGGRYGPARLPTLHVPATLQGSLIARLDRLAGSKGVAQMGAVIGREFAYALLARLADIPPSELDAALETLVASGLVHRRGDPPEAVYSFKHALIRDAAYESLLKSQRRRLHGRVAEVLEEGLPERAEADLLAHHCAEAGLTEKAVDYRRAAGRRALERSATAEAIAQARWGLELLSRLSETPEGTRRELDLQLILALALLALEGTSAEEVGQAFARAHDLCQRIGAELETFQALFGKWLFHYTRAELEAGRATADEFLRRAQDQDDTGVLLTGHRIAGASALVGGDLVEARAHYEGALAASDAPGRQPSRFVYSFDVQVVCSHHLAWTLLFLGYPEQAEARSREACAQARELSHPSTLALSLFFEGAFAQFRRDRPAEVWRAAEALAALAGEQRLPFWSAAGRVLQGWALAEEEAGREEGIARIRHATADYQATGGAICRPYFFALLAEGCAKAGRGEEAANLLTEALADAERIGEHWYQAELHRREGELLARSDPDRAEACFRRALILAERQSARLWQLRAATSLARLWRRRGKRREAYDLLAPIHGWFTEGSDAPDLVEAEGLIDKLRSKTRRLWML